MLQERKKGKREFHLGIMFIQSRNFLSFVSCYRFKSRPSPPWTAILSAGGVLTISLLLSHILHAAINRIVKVEEDCQKMTELKARAEAADVAKSQVSFTIQAHILDLSIAAFSLIVSL